MIPKLMIRNFNKMYQNFYIILIFLPILDNLQEIDY